MRSLGRFNHSLRDDLITRRADGGQAVRWNDYEAGETCMITQRILSSQESCRVQIRSDLHQHCAACAYCNPECDSV